MNVPSTALLCFVLAGSAALAQATVTPGDLLAHGATYDGKMVTVSGTVARIEHKTSKSGNNYTTFDLCTGSQCIRVFEYGNPSITAGSTAALTGTYSVEKHVGSAIYHDELDVEGD